MNGAAGDPDNDQEEDDDLSGEEEEEGDDDDEGWFLSTVLDPLGFQSGSGSRALMTTKCESLQLKRTQFFLNQKLLSFYSKAS